MKTQKFINALNRVQRYFPEVEKVKDATKPITINVIKQDTKGGRKKDPRGCALARACVREKKATGAIVGIGMTWLINGKEATRYQTSVGVSREITSFDRHQDFAVGKDYLLAAVSPARRLGKHPSKVRGPHVTKAKEPVVFHHRTKRVRVV